MFDQVGPWRTYRRMRADAARQAAIRTPLSSPTCNVDCTQRRLQAIMGALSDDIIDREHDLRELRRLLASGAPLLALRRVGYVSPMQFWESPASMHR